MKSVTRDLQSLGLPSLPIAQDRGSTSALEMLAHDAAQGTGRERAVQAAMDSRKGFKSALKVLVKPERKGLAAVDAVCGLLRMYDAGEVDRLLLDCDESERRFLLGCLMK